MNHKKPFPEGMFDGSINSSFMGMNTVDDCQIIPKPEAGKQYFATQPGISIVASLADGEALEKQAL